MKVWTRAQPSDAQMSAVAAADPTNPFASAEYARAQATLGAEVVLFAFGDDERVTAGVFGFVRGRRTGRWLEIPSAQLHGSADEFWREVEQFVRQRRVIRVEVGTFGAVDSSLPVWSVPKTEIERTEWRLALADASPADFASNHRRNIGKAKKAGVTMSISSSADAAMNHARLMAASMDRRQERGEEVPAISDNDRRTTAALLDSGAARAYQASFEGEVVSSLLVLRSADGAYYHSAGTSPKGMEIGASTYLVSEIIRDLKESGASLFNFGGANKDEAPGLARFKQGFGALPLELRAGDYVFASPLELRVRKTVGLLRHPSQLRRGLVSVDEFAVYSASPKSVGQPLADGLRLEKLDDEALRAISRDPELSDQFERVGRVGFNSAYALWRNSDLLHVAWLIEHSDDARSGERNVKLRSGEAEITHCQTPQRMRGQGAYPLAIGALANVAREKGVNRIFMITNVKNVSSRRGITKAGLKPAGRIWRISIRYDRLVVTLRGHRFLLSR